MKTVGPSPNHGEPDTVKVVRPVRREGRRNLPLKSGKALLPYSTVPEVVRLAMEMGFPEAALWVREHTALYAAGFLRGFEPTDRLDEKTIRDMTARFLDGEKGES